MSMLSRARMLAVLTIAVLTGMVGAGAQQTSGAIAVDADDIAGIVTSTNGPEAGVWVIAETTDLPTKFARIVVTDDAGRYLVPDLPPATYDVWVRGYGLVDSPRVRSKPGSRQNLTATPAPTPMQAAALYPANYWFSLLKVPPADHFPGTGAEGNAIPANIGSHAQYMSALRIGCLNCHQLGNVATREIPKELGTFASSTAAWDHRVKVGQTGPSMSGGLNRLGRERALEMFADWTDRIAAGALPPVPPRPQGRERNVVISMWDWGPTPVEFVHDQIVTDKRDPKVNAHGPVYGVASGSDGLVWVDPREHKAFYAKMPTANPSLTGPLGSSVLVPSPYYGTELYWRNPAYPHNPMMDQAGRVWSTATIRDPRVQPAFCTDGARNKFAAYFPLQRSGKQVSLFDPKTQQFVSVDTCFGTHHLQFAFDAANTLYFSGGSGGYGWMNTRQFSQTGNAEASQGWCPAVLDTNGDGKITKPWTEPNEPIDPTKDARIDPGAYGNAVNPVDNSAWYSSFHRFPGVIWRLDRGSNPPETCIAEAYQVPLEKGHSPHAIDFDRNGVAWVNLSGSGHFASFDRRKCKVLRGPTATGTHCPEGWTVYPMPGPMMQGTDVNADYTYITWVDQFNTFGLGENVPMTQGANGDALYALLPQTGEWVTLRVPYPLGFYARGHDGRIDDAQAGWKGRGLWSTYANTSNWHIEGGKGTYSKVVKFQLRPNPLAR
jgi:hypothetical protein